MELRDFVVPFPRLVVEAARKLPMASGCPAMMLFGSECGLSLSERRCRPPADSAWAGTGTKEFPESSDPLLRL